MVWQAMSGASCFHWRTSTDAFLLSFAHLTVGSLHGYLAMPLDTSGLAEDTREKAKEPRLVWHATRSDIERPTIAGRTAGDNHANSGLGIFCASFADDYLYMFGEFIHELTLRDDARALRMPTTQLRLMGYDQDREVDREWFEAQGRKLGQQYDLIELEEIDGQVNQVILLNDEVIVSSRKLEPDAFQVAMATKPTPKRMAL